MGALGPKPSARAGGEHSVGPSILVGLAENMEDAAPEASGGPSGTGTPNLESPGHLGLGLPSCMEAWQRNAPFLANTMHARGLLRSNLSEAMASYLRRCRRDPCPLPLPLVDRPDGASSSAG